MRLEFSRSVFTPPPRPAQNNETSNFMEIRQVGAELFHAWETDRQTDSYGVGNIRVLKFC